MDVNGKPVRAMCLCKNKPIGPQLAVVELDGDEPESAVYGSLASSWAEVAVLLTRPVEIGEFVERVQRGEAVVGHEAAVCLVDLRAFRQGPERPKKSNGTSGKKLETPEA